MIADRKDTCRTAPCAPRPAQVRLRRLLGLAALACIASTPLHAHVPETVPAEAVGLYDGGGFETAMALQLHADGTFEWVLAVGAPATYAIWEPGPLAVQAPDGRIAAWSTDPRSGTPPLPDLTSGTPRCWRTVRAGVTIFDSGDLA